MAEEIKSGVSKFVSGKITNRKLNSDNFLHLKRVVEIYVTGRTKDHYLMLPRSKDADLEAG